MPRQAHSIELFIENKDMVGGDGTLKRIYPEVSFEKIEHAKKYLKENGPHGVDVYPYRPCLDKPLHLAEQRTLKFV